MVPGDQGLNGGRLLLAVGRLGRAHGVRGEVRVEVLTDFPEQRFAPGSRLLLGDDDEDLGTSAQDSTPLEGLVVGSARPHGDVLLVRFEEVPDRTAAEALTGRTLFIDAEDAIELGPDAYYEHELIGCAVVTTAGADVGVVTGVRESPAADLLVVRLTDEGREVLVPMVGAVVQRVDLERGEVVVDVIPGLLD